MSTPAESTDLWFAPPEDLTTTHAAAAGPPVPVGARDVEDALTDATDALDHFELRLAAESGGILPPVGQGARPSAKREPLIREPARAAPAWADRDAAPARVEREAAPASEDDEEPVWGGAEEAAHAPLDPQAFAEPAPYAEAEDGGYDAQGYAETDDGAYADGGCLPYDALHLEASLDEVACEDAEFDADAWAHPAAAVDGPAWAAAGAEAPSVPVHSNTPAWASDPAGAVLAEDPEDGALAESDAEVDFFEPETHAAQAGVYAQSVHEPHGAALADDALFEDALANDDGDRVLDPHAFGARRTGHDAFREGGTYAPADDGSDEAYALGDDGFDEGYALTDDGSDEAYALGDDGFDEGYALTDDGSDEAYALTDDDSDEGYALTDDDSDEGYALTDDAEEAYVLGDAAVAEEARPAAARSARRPAAQRVVRARVASLGARSLAWAVDGGVLVATLSLLLWIAGRIAGAEAGLTVAARDLHLALYSTALCALIGTVYSALAVALGGQTLGGWVAGVRILDGRGENPTLGRALTRALAAVPGTLALLVGYAWALVDDRGQALHDKVTRTYAVEA